MYRYRQLYYNEAVTSNLKSLIKVTTKVAAVSITARLNKTSSIVLVVTLFIGNRGFSIFFSLVGIYLEVEVVHTKYVRNFSYETTAETKVKRIPPFAASNSKTPFPVSTGEPVNCRKVNKAVADHKSNLTLKSEASSDTSC